MKKGFVITDLTVEKKCSDLGIKLNHRGKIKLGKFIAGNYVEICKENFDELIRYEKRPEGKFKKVNHFPNWFDSIMESLIKIWLEENLQYRLKRRRINQ